MRFVSILLVLIGYTLVYASIANHGKMATHPWMALFQDAYTGAQPPAMPQQPLPGQQQSTPPSTTVHPSAPYQPPTVQA